MQAEAHEALPDRLVERWQRCALGDPLDERTELGPTLSRARFNRLTHAVQEACERGARLCTGGQRAPGRGFFLHPTVVDQVTPALTIAHRTLQGPVTAVIEFRDTAHLCELAEQLDAGAAVAIHTADVAGARRLAEALRARRTWINCDDGPDPHDRRLRFDPEREGGPAAIAPFLDDCAVASTSR